MSDAKMQLMPFQNTVRELRTTMQFEFTSRYWLVFMENFAGNILMFIPFGFLLAALGKPGLRIVLFAAFTSVFIELMQYFFHVGVCDVDDIILNSSGAFLGFLLYLLARWVPKSEPVKVENLELEI